MPQFKLDNGKANWNAIAKEIEGCDKTALSYFKTLDNGSGTINNQSASVEGLGAHIKATGQSFGFAAIKATLLNTALNTGIFLLASAAIQGMAKALDNYVHRVEKARERTDELFNEFRQMNDTLADHRKTVSESADRYDELSKGVNRSTNDNVSLSTEEYEEFLDINEKLANSFPELAKGIDNNGNSILALGTKGITAKEELEELLQTEENLNNFRIAQGLEDAFKGVCTYVEDANEAAEKLHGTISDSGEAMGKLQDIAENGIKLTGENNQLIFAGSKNNQAELDYMNTLTDSIHEFWQSLDGDRRMELGIGPSDLFTQNYDEYTGAFQIYANLYKLTPKELTALENIIQDNVGDASGALLDSISEQTQEELEKIQKSENAWTDFIPALVAGMKSKQTFKNLDSDLQDIAVQIIEGLDDSYASAMKAYDPDPYAYIRDKFIVPMSKLSDNDKQKLQSDFENLLKLDADNLAKNNQAEIEKFIASIAALLNKDPLEIRTALRFETEDAQKGYNEALKQAKRQFGGYGHDDRGFEINNAVGNQLDRFWSENVVTEEDWALWQKVTARIDDITKAIAVYTQAREAANATNQNSEPIAFSPESFSETIKALSSLQSLYNDFYNHVKDNNDFAFAFTDIESLRETFGETCAEFDHFERLATSSSTSAEELQESFDRLATQYVIRSLDGLNKSTREQIISQLELQGIIGSSGLLTEDLANAYGILSDNGYTLADATDAAYRKLVDEATQSDITKGAIYALAAAEIAYNNTGLNVQDKISQLGELALAYGDTTTAAIAQAAADRVAMGHGDYESVYADMIASANRATQTSTLKLRQSPANASKGGGGSASPKETAEEFDWTEKKIKSLEEAVSRLDKVADSAYSSIAEKNQALAQSIQTINEEIRFQKQAYEQYMQKAESAGLPDAYQNLVQNGAVNIEEIADEDLKEAIKNYEKWFDKAKETQDKINDLYEDAKDKHVEGYELEAGEIEKLRENQAVTEREYLDAMLALYEKYYAGQSGFTNQAKEARLKYLQEEKDCLNTIAEAASSLLDNQIDETEGERDKARKVYEDEIAGIEETIKAKEKEKDAIRLKIDALKEEEDELDRQKSLLDAIKSKEEALYALERAKSQRNKLLYQDGQMVWAADDAAIKEADQKVEDAQSAVDKAEREIAIADLERQIGAIQDGIDALEDQKAELEALADKSDAFFDKKIADIKAYQNAWKKALDAKEHSAALSALESMFGNDAAEQVLAHSMTLLSEWKQDYIDIMAAIDLAADGSVSLMTSAWGELAGVSADMDNALQLAGLSLDAFTDRAQRLGSAVSETAEASERAGNALNSFSPLPADTQLQHIGLPLQEIQTQVSGLTEKLNALACDVQNYAIPAINTQQFTASLGGDDEAGGILGALNAFVRRYHEICASIPGIWDGAMLSMSGQGAVTNGEAVSCAWLFRPLVNAMDTAGLEIDAKLQEYAGAWTQFNTSLGDIIGTGSGSAQPGGGGASKPSSSENNNAQAGTDTIVGTIQAGGEASVSALNKAWIPGFEGFASSIDKICASICSMVEDMANDVIDMANKALNAMKQVESKNTGAYKIGRVGSGYSPHTVSAAHAHGTLSFPDTGGAVAGDQTSLVNELGNEMLIRDGVLREIPGGAQMIRLKRGDIILNHKQARELKKYGRVSSNGGHGRLIGSFASGAGASPAVSTLERSIRDICGSGEFRKLLADVEKLRAGRPVIVESGHTLLRDKSGNPYREGTVITPNGEVYTPLPDGHPAIRMRKGFESYLQTMGGTGYLEANAMAQHTREMENMVKQITNSTVISNHNNIQPVINMGGVTITCPGVTDQQVMKHVGIAMEHEFSGLAMKAYQKSMISR